MLALSLVAVVAAACGGGDDPTATSPANTPTQPAVNTPTATRPATTQPTGTPAGPTATPTQTSQLPTATATATAAPINEDLPEPENPVGTVVVVIQTINSHPGINSAQGGEASVFWGAGETLFTTRTGPVFGEPWLAKEWEVAQDLSSVTVTVQEGVQFHKGHGEMTATDVAWSINDANSFTNPESIHAQAGDLNPIFGEIEVIDTYTMRMPFRTYDPRWQSNALSDGWQPTGVFSKTVFDTMGRDWMLQNTIMTGPFEVRHWLQGDNATLDAVDNHWRKTPEIDTIIYRAIPDPTVRITQLRTGEADAGDITLADVPTMVEEGFALSGTGNGSEVNVPFAGNLWEETDRNGQPLTREGFKPELPWLGDPDDETDMENARKVRWALSMAINRTELKDVLTAGLGWETGIAFFNVRMPQYQEKWDVPYDVQGAKDLLVEAGYPDGFSIQIFGESNNLLRTETATAIGAMWQQELGLDVEVLSTDYQATWRPGLVARQHSIPFINSCDDGRFPRPWDWPVGLTTSSLSRGGFSCAFESPVIRDNWLAAASEADIQTRIELTNEVADYMHHWMLMPGTVTIPVLLVYNPRSIESWNMRPSLGGPISSPEMIVPAER
jgi:ABC-type transport system substrate-binding protein